jgi:hypothetical protein
MTVALEQFIATARRIADQNGLAWNPPIDRNGDIAKAHRWNLGRLVGAPSNTWFSTFGWTTPILNALASFGLENRASQNIAVMSLRWREFLQAAVIHSVLVKRQAPQSIYRLSRTIKVLAVSAPEVSPGDLTLDQVRQAYNVALRMGDGEAARTFPGFVRGTIDTQHLAVRPNLASACTAYADPVSAAAQAIVDAANARSNSKGYRTKKPILKQLEERKDASKLPGSDAFWELCRIVFTEEPRSLHDLQLFAASRLHIITGLRAVEVALLPLNWKHEREWTDINGNAAGLRGGISRSLAIRHFAAKQGSRAKGEQSRQLVPKLQDVPMIFEDIVAHTLKEVEIANRPLRDTLTSQLSTGRLFPDLDPGALVPVWEMHIRLFGSAQISSTPIPQHLQDKYRNGVLNTSTNQRFRFNPAVLSEIRLQQIAALGIADVCKHAGATRGTLHPLVQSYWFDTRAKLTTDIFRDQEGNELQWGERVDWSQVYIRVGEAEDELRRRGQARTLDDPSLAVAGETSIRPDQFLFLTGFDKGGVRSDANLFDAEKFYAVRRFYIDEVIRAFGGHRGTSHLSIFFRYGRTDEDRSLQLNTHALRHLQNTELFRKGLADSIITKRFNRVSVQQSYVYDHRSLAEHLDGIDVPDDVEEKLGVKAGTTYRLIRSGRVSGPLVDRFLSIQADEGDDAAFEFLVAEADGLHVTPYGFCLNSFTVDPCPKHLECFNGCLHLARSDLPSERLALTSLRERTAAVVAKIEAYPEGSVGRQNQLDHARKRLGNIDKALATAPGEKPFPKGPDLSVPIAKATGSTLIDRPPPSVNILPNGLDMSDA